jgi:hypothetical protein
VVAQGQLIDPLHQHRQPVAGAQNRIQRVRIATGTTQNQRRQIHRRQHVQALVAAVQRRLQRFAQRDCPSSRRDQQGDALRLTALGHQPAKAGLDHPRLATAGLADDQQRAAPMGDRLALSG